MNMKRQLKAIQKEVYHTRMESGMITAIAEFILKDLTWKELAAKTLVFL